ncbi:MAG: hypothetical protein HRU69_11990 [Flammeovirgaceae bacterium]|nr:MAG: hypothetical protein HRU69_11990 [Flammeovirgaceae bacterium]
MKVLICFINLLAGILFITPSSAQQYRIFINPSSRVTVYGSTNVNQFKFRYTENISIDRPVKVDSENKILKLSGCQIDLKIHAFDSGNPIMNKDFRKMLNEDESPFIRVNLLSLAPEWERGGSWRKGKVEVLVEINTIAKKFVFDCTLENPGSLYIFGRQRISLTEFELTPPTRMMGMVRVSEWVDLDLELRFGTDG